MLLVFIFHSLYNERREKQAAAQQTFVFHKPLTNESPAKAGSKARMRGKIASGRERREKQAAAQQTFVFLGPLTNESPA